MNRIWQFHFGQGLVGTPSNFGQLGERPSHPELLDYLAATFVEQRWSIKAMHREVMLVGDVSSEHGHGRQESGERPGQTAWLWRATCSQRLDAEALRDSLLAVSGELDRDDWRSAGCARMNRTGGRTRVRAD